MATTQLLIDEALDMREMATRKLRAEKAVQLDRRADHAVATGTPFGSAYAHAEKWYAVAADMLRQAETFIWTRDTEAQAVHAARKLPVDVPFHRAWLPVSCGYWWLGRDSAWKLWCETNRDYDPTLPATRHVCCVTYMVVDDWIMIEAMTLEHGEPTPGPTTIMGLAWKEGETLTDLLARLKGYRGSDLPWWDESAEATARLVMGACLWLQQRVVNATVVFGSRAARRRLERQQINSATRVITLRKAEQEHYEATGDGTPLQWRVPVIGHWRNQPYPTKGYVLPIWIDDHWRGPEDAPVRAPSRIIYKVAR